MKLTDIPKVDEEQARFGARLGLSLLGQPLPVARARINDAVHEGLYGAKLREPTMRQLELLHEWGLADSVESIGVASAFIECGLLQLDMNSVRDQELEPGVTVVDRKDPERRHRVISSVKPWGLVYFKGGRGAKAPARVLQRVLEIRSAMEDGGVRNMDLFEAPGGGFGRPRLRVVSAR